MTNLSSAQRWALFTMFAIAGILNLVDRQLISVLKPTIAGELGWTDNDYGTLAAWFQGSMAVALLATGWLADRLGARWANAVGVFTWSIAAFFHGLAHSLTQFILCRVALGATEAMATPAGIKMMAAIFPPQMRTVGFGIANAIGSVSGIIAPILIPLIAAPIGWRGAFMAFGALGVVWAFVWIWMTRGIDFADSKSQTQANEAEEADPAERAPSLLRQRSTWAIAGAKTLSDLTWWLMLFWMPDLLHRQFGLEGVTLGLALGVAYAGAAVGAIIGGVVPSWAMARGASLNRTRRMSLFVSALVALVLPFVLLVDNYWAAAMILGLVLAAHQGFSTNLFALITDVAPANRIGQLTGLAAFSGNMGGAVMVKVAGMVLVAGFGYGPILIFCASTYLLATGWIQLMLPRLEDRAPGAGADVARLGH